MCFISYRRPPAASFTALHHAVLNEQHLIDSNDDEQIVSICNSMLKKTEKNRDQYDSLHLCERALRSDGPLLASTPLKQKETMIFVLFEYLQNLITELKE